MYFSDGHLSDLGQRSFASDLEGSTVQKLRLLLRVSVSEGMRLVYNQYCQRKQQQVQQTARDIIARLEGDNNESAANQEVMLGEVNRGQAGTDRSAGGWTSMDSMFYRGS